MNETQRLEKIARLAKKVKQKMATLKYATSPTRRAELDAEIADLQAQIAKLREKA